MVDVPIVVGGIAVVLVGLVPAALPYATASASEIIDAVGSTTSASEVEPAEWKVTWTRLTGVVVILVGGYLVLKGLTA